jgi:hypothetical protein
MLLPPLRNLIGECIPLNVRSPRGQVAEGDAHADKCGIDDIRAEHERGRTRSGAKCLSRERTQQVVGSETHEPVHTKRRIWMKQAPGFCWPINCADQRHCYFDARKLAHRVVLELGDPFPIRVVELG